MRYRIKPNSFNLFKVSSIWAFGYENVYLQIRSSVCKFKYANAIAINKFRFAFRNFAFSIIFAYLCTRIYIWESGGTYPYLCPETPKTPLSDERPYPSVDVGQGHVPKIVRLGVVYSRSNFVRNFQWAYPTHQPNRQCHPRVLPRGEHHVADVWRG